MRRIFIVLTLCSLVMSMGCSTLSGIEHAMIRNKALASLEAEIPEHSLEKDGYEIKFRKDSEPGGIVVIVTVPRRNDLARSQVWEQIANDVMRVESRKCALRDRLGTGYPADYVSLKWILEIQDVNVFDIRDIAKGHNLKID